MSEAVLDAENRSLSESDRGDDVLVFEDVRKTFPTAKRRTLALDGVSFSIQRGGITGLIGPDGAGKTTLMRLGAGLLRADSGQVTTLGFDTQREPLKVQAAIGYMPQHFGLYEDLSVQENLDLYADLQGLRKEERTDQYEELMRMTGLAPFTERLAGRLSGGMKQKLGLACMLLSARELLLLDEPTVGVDPVSRRELWSIVSRLVREEEMSVLLTTAYLDEAERCDQVILLQEGMILGTGPPETFSRELKGQTFLVRAGDMKKRTLQEHLAGREGVIDSVIQGERVRLVLEFGKEPDGKAFLSPGDVLDVESVEPRFEDGYIARLRAYHREEKKGESSPAAKGQREEQSSPTHARPGDSDSVIEVEHAKRKFGNFWAVKDITFDVRVGEVFGLLGANGAGKSTTFRMLCGLLPASGGSLKVAGKDLRHAAAAARERIGYMSQKFSLYRVLSVRQNLEFFSRVYGLSGRRRTEQIEWSMDQFQLGPVADATSGNLPLGFKQRLALSCALMHEPDILFLDEPTSGVDPLARREFWHHINRFAEKGVTVLVTTHFMEEAEYCDRLAIMVAGEILALGTPKEIKESASSTDRPDPTMEDAFIALIESKEAKGIEEGR
jgi:ABC-2 type transport system ATP-binding protein